MVRRAFRAVRDYLPRGNTLDDETFRQRHLLLCWVLALHIPALFAFGLWQGFSIVHSAEEVIVPVGALIFARLSINRRLAAFFVTAGLVFCSTALVHLSGGTIEAHFHFFILIGLIALYQDWVPFVWNVLFTFLSHGIGTVIASDIMFAHTEGQSRPWTWAAVHGGAVLAACVGEIVFWKNTEREQQRNVALVEAMATAQADQRTAVSELLVNLARRNQSLLNRQLGLISDLEQRERQPAVLDDLFQLDHLATRIRRNAESLLVLSGDDAPRRWGKPVPLSEVVRAAAAEVEDYRRVDVLVNDHLEVTGRAVADLAHLLAELIENATTFSPPSSQVLVRSHVALGEPRGFVVSVEDVGIGMTDDEMRRANSLLAHAPEVDLRRSSMLGFQVVARLAARYGIRVSLVPTPGGGVTALVSMPPDLAGERGTHLAADGFGNATFEASRVSGIPAPGTNPSWARQPVGVAQAAVARAPFVDAAPFGDGAPVGAVRTAADRPGEIPEPGDTTWRPRITEPIPVSEVVRPAAGLAQRVPGAHLAPALRRDIGDLSGMGGPGGPVGRDPARVRSMLSRFQSGQRAGRAVSSLPPSHSSPQPPDPGSNSPQEDR
jgi:signal transduction histidine kinase